MLPNTSKQIIFRKPSHAAIDSVFGVIARCVTLAALLFSSNTARATVYPAAGPANTSAVAPATRSAHLSALLAISDPNTHATALRAAQLGAQLETDWQHPGLNFALQHQIIREFISLPSRSDPSERATVQYIIRGWLVDYAQTHHVVDANRTPTRLVEVLMIDLAAALKVSANGDTVAAVLYNSLIAGNSGNHPLAGTTLLTNYISEPDLPQAFVYANSQSQNAMVSVTTANFVAVALLGTCPDINGSVTAARPSAGSGGVTSFFERNSCYAVAYWTHVANTAICVFIRINAYAACSFDAACFAAATAAYGTCIDEATSDLNFSLALCAAVY